MNKHHQRVTGAFFTPKIWIDEAHREIEKALGENWKNEWVVWDCCCGTANLTRDYKFKELYLSTLEQGDINDIKAAGYNPEAKAIFQYDFLSECPIKDALLPEDRSGISKVPWELQNAFKEGKKILFLINPPYGAAGSGLGKKGKTGVQYSSVHSEMKNNGVGSCRSQLYAQFLYKVFLLQKKFPNAKVGLGLFSPPSYLNYPSYSELRKKWTNTFSFISGFSFLSKSFSEVKSKFEICFSLWTKKEVSSREQKYYSKLKETTSEGILTIGSKQFSAAENESCLYWTKRDSQSFNKVECVPLSSALNTRPKCRGRISEGYVGYMRHEGKNNVIGGKRGTYLLSSIYASGMGFAILPKNILKSLSYFAAMKLTKIVWWNGDDPYFVPNTSHPDYPQWNNDAIVYSLFHGSSQQSSLRRVDYKGKKWDVKNEFFFMSKEEMQKLAEEYDYRDMIRDLVDEKDRYVYKVLEETNLSPDAQEVLDEARELIRISIEERESFAKENPDKHLQAWDAGWAQIKHLLKKHHMDRYNNFVQLYKKFEERMREGVYKFGFIKNTFTTRKENENE